MCRWFCSDGATDTLLSRLPVCRLYSRHIAVIITRLDGCSENQQCYGTRAPPLRICLFIECVLERQQQREMRWQERMVLDKRCLNASRAQLSRMPLSRFGFFGGFFQFGFLIPRTANPEPSANSSSLTGRSRGCQKQEKASLISLDKCTKPRSSSDRTDRSLCIAGTESPKPHRTKPDPQPSCKFRAVYRMSNTLKVQQIERMMCCESWVGQHTHTALHFWASLIGDFKSVSAHRCRRCRSRLER